MSLFRYLGDEEEEDSAPVAKDHATAILNKLHQQAQARKKKRKSTDVSTKDVEENLSTSIDEGDKGADLKKPKKRKRESPADQGKSTDKKKKRKSKRLSEKDTEEEESSANIASSLPFSESTTTTGDKSDSESEADEEEDEGEVDDSNEDDEMEPDAEDEDEEDGFSKDGGQSHRQIGGFTVIGDVFQKKKEKVNKSPTIPCVSMVRCYLIIESEV